MDKNSRKFDPYEIINNHTVQYITIINANIPYNWPAGP